MTRRHIGMLISIGALWVLRLSLQRDVSTASAIGIHLVVDSLNTAFSLAVAAHVQRTSNPPIDTSDIESAVFVLPVLSGAFVVAGLIALFRTLTA